MSGHFLKDKIWISKYVAQKNQLDFFLEHENEGIRHYLKRQVKKHKVYFSFEQSHP